MRIIPNPVSFEWDAGNIDKSEEKHDVANKEAEEPFSNNERFYFEDKKHSEPERRYMLWGKTNKGRLLSIIFTIRRERVRIISARDMNRKERRAYEEKIKANTKI